MAESVSSEASSPEAFQDLLAASPSSMENRPSEGEDGGVTSDGGPGPHAGENVVIECCDREHLYRHIKELAENQLKGGYVKGRLRLPRRGPLGRARYRIELSLAPIDIALRGEIR